MFFISLPITLRSWELEIGGKIRKLAACSDYKNSFVNTFKFAGKEENGQKQELLHKCLLIVKEFELNSV